MLCSGFGRFIAERDVQVGSTLAGHYGLHIREFETTLLIRRPRLRRVEAFVHIMRQLGRARPASRVRLALPRPFWPTLDVRENAEDGRYRLGLPCASKAT